MGQAANAVDRRRTFKQMACSIGSDAAVIGIADLLKQQAWGAEGIRVISRPALAV